jgi:hypothetical protein
MPPQAGRPIVPAAQRGSAGIPNAGFHQDMLVFPNRTGTTAMAKMVRAR